jgi:glyoxylase-like metal-dependent hydrolase (beta-lactamase superfamily II)
MARDLLQVSDDLLSGRTSTKDHHPVSMAVSNELLELGDNLAFVESFANVAAIRSGGELALVDPGSVIYADLTHTAIRSWTSDPLTTAVYTHGHVDHCFGVGRYETESGAQAQVVAHEAVPDRFDRYRLTNGYNGVINMRQFRLGAPMFPTEFRYPDETYRDSIDLTVGDIALQLHHDRGETDDHTWVWMPEGKVLFTGDLFIWVSPNCGNPQKAQRYPKEWTAALRKMAALSPEMLLPGHGLPIVGADHVQMVLVETAEYLESILNQSLELMNSGATLDDLIHGVKPPQSLTDRPWLQPIYDEPEFIVHNIWRLYGGWYTGNPATLKPAPDAEVALEVASLAGGADKLADRATELADQGNFRLACHLIEMAASAADDDPAIHEQRRAIYSARVEAETSVMAKGIYSWAEHESAEVARES